MASFDYAKQAALFDVSLAVTSDAIDGYLQAHVVPMPPPDTLPGTHCEIVTRYYPDAAALAATDWRRI